jgi:hypothetical protein
MGREDRLMSFKHSFEEEENPNMAESIKDGWQFFFEVNFTIGGHTYSFNEMFKEVNPETINDFFQRVAHDAIDLAESDE